MAPVLNGKSIFLAIFIFSLLFLPLSPSDAARTPRIPTGSISTKRPICPACVCCEPPPLGSCCRCCPSPIQTQSHHSQSP
ncbi:PREDICTED: uncharacterized protein LOC104810546 [Tarenaya hassleriana]|uniref:uncharacterized protein LOC104810546 n=1 Tax=Tarenaya hassleriana TaxID=28532 RepID=UPI0008FD0057|nr:PREDICTED: uncharacterized protein LOC104810546 [Tarenaya hassleriana]